MPTDGIFFDSVSRRPVWFWRHIDEITDRFQFLTTGRVPSRWLERDLYESMGEEIRKEIDSVILRDLSALKPGKEE